MKCIILTIAYNAEKTIARTIESVLAQTGADWTYYLVDNGSTDATYEICCQYAGKHDKIVLWKEEKNNISAMVKYFNRLIEERPDAEGLCRVDADDVLTPEFLYTAVALMEKYGADLVILGTELIDADTGKVVVSNTVSCEQVVSRKNIGTVFPQIHWFLRQMWCKLYRTSVLRSYEMSIYKEISYGGDTALVLQFLDHADKFVLAPVCGYRYSLSFQSSSYRFVPERYEEDQILFQYTIDFLEHQVGYVSERNRAFMLAVYCHAMEDTLKVAIHADASPQQKLIEIYGTYCNPITEELFRKGSEFLQQKDWKYRMNVPVIACMLAAANTYTQEDIRKVASVFDQMNGQFMQMIPEGHLQWMMRKAPRIVERIALCCYEDAFDVLWEQFAGGIFPCCEYTLSLGQLLSGALLLENEYAMFSKLLIGWYIEHGQLDRAHRELSDWLLILPEDKEIIELKDREMRIWNDSKKGEIK